MSLQVINLKKAEVSNMRITKVELKPLQKIKQLKKLKPCNCMSCDCENNMFTVTFKIGDTGTKELLQDLTLIFEKHVPKIYISNPYTRNNAENEM